MRILNLGAGVQSSTLLLLSHRGMLEPLDAAIFADTGWEPPVVYDHLAWLEQQTDVPVYHVQAGNLRDDLMASIGAPPHSGMASPPYYVDVPGQSGRGMLRRKCTRDYKITPIVRKIRELVGVGHGQRVPKGVMIEQWLGISTDEAHRMKPATEKWITRRWPLCFDLRWSRARCLEWLASEGYPEPPKSACVGCPFASDERWRDLAKTEVWDDIVETDKAVRRGLPGVRGAVYLHSSLRPMDERPFENGGQRSLFGNECDGICGV